VFAIKGHALPYRKVRSARPHLFDPLVLVTFQKKSWPRSWRSHLDDLEQFDKPLFHNAHHERLTRSGIRYILRKYVVLAQSKRPSLNRTVSPHTLRHTKGMHLLQSGVSLDMIRDFLGHVDGKTTQTYARANLEMKRNALEKISEPSLVQTIPCWQQNKDLLDWLRSL
jgi:integrase/recombinase XerD